MKVFEFDSSFPEQALSGIDEVGRGCLAGPVVVARVTWNPWELADQAWFAVLDDSKALDQGERERLFPQILAAAKEVRIAVLNQILIDYLDILRATLHGFELVAPGYDPEIPLLIDGNQAPPRLRYAQTLVKGDSRCSAIAAAGVLAKVVRDHLMVHFGKELPGYGFEIHKGYATAEHRRALEQLGPTRLHRKSFEPVTRHFLQPSCDDEGLQEQIRAADRDRERLAQAYAQLERNYEKYSCEAAMKAVRQLQEQGFKLLPIPSEPVPPYQLVPLLGSR